MKKMSSWLLTIFIIIYYVFRFIISIIYGFGIEFIIKPINFNAEKILLFGMIITIILICKRNQFGGIMYAVLNVFYFGLYLFNAKSYGTDQETITNLIVSIVPLVLSVGILIDLSVNKDRHEGKDNRDTYWFYKDEKYDRKLDDRADKNQYKL